MLRNLLNSIQERKKSVNGLVGVIFPVWTPITPVSRNGRRRREPIRPDTPGISGEETRMRIPVVSLPRAMWASERRGGEGSTNERSSPLLRSRFRDERKKNEERNRCEFAAGSSHTHPPNVLLSNVERSIRISMLMEGKVERWWHSRVEHFMFVNLLLRLKFTDATGR